MKIITNSPKQTTALGEKIAKALRKNEILALYGTLGSGKTTFTKGLAAGLGIDKHDVSSPSFVLLKEYKGRFPLYHFDLYRVKDPREIFNVGFQEYISSGGVIVIEWAERMDDYLPKEHLKIEFELKGNNQRSIKILPKGKICKRFMAKL